MGLADITYCGNGIVLVGFTGLVMRSTDYGATFTYVTDFGVLTRGLAYCGNGVVIVHTHGHEYALRSTDYGISYSRITLPGAHVELMDGLGPVLWQRRRHHCIQR